MKKTIEKYYCDICQEQKDKETLKNVEILTYSTHSSEDGVGYNASVFGTNVMFHSSNVDICFECAKKIAVVKDDGGIENRYKFTGGFKGEKQGEKF